MLSSSMMHAIKLIEKVFFSTSIVASRVNIYHQNFSTLPQMNCLSFRDHVMQHVCMMY